MQKLHQFDVFCLIVAVLEYLHISEHFQLHAG